MSSNTHMRDPVIAARDQQSSVESSNHPAAASAVGEHVGGIPPRIGQQLPGPRVEPTPRTDTLPLSFAQQRLWFIGQMFPQAPTYNEPIMVRMEGPVDAAVLAQCLTEITRRHEAWRTVFETVDGQPVQQIQPNRPFE